MSCLSRRAFAGGMLGANLLRAQTAAQPDIPQVTEQGQRALEAARAAIPRIRMRDVELALVDRSGEALPKVAVEVVQVRHAFPFGDNMWDLDKFFRNRQQDADRARYWKQHFLEALTAATALCYWTERPTTDSAKTEDAQGEPMLDGFAYCVDWAAAHGLTVKGHPLFWSIPKAIPEWVKRYDYATQMKFAEVRVRDLVARFRGRVAIWDVVNEALWEASPRHLPERHWPHLETAAEMADYVGRVIRWAREEDPDATLVLNDYGLEQDYRNGAPVALDGTRVTAALQRKRMLELVRTLRSRGTPPGAIGMQSHPDGWMEPAAQRRLYDEMAEAGLPLHVTEFSAGAPRGVTPAQADQLAADYVANIMTVAFGHAAVEAFFFWGTDGIAWREPAGRDPAKVFARVRDLIHKEWNTRVSLVSDEGGRVRFRGFLGEYALRRQTGPSLSEGVRFAVNRQETMPLRLTVPRVAGN
jgi:endo-1,4-beta-xylanase